MNETKALTGVENIIATLLATEVCCFTRHVKEAGGSALLYQSYLPRELLIEAGVNILF